MIFEIFVQWWERTVNSGNISQVQKRILSAEVLIGQWRREYNEVRPSSACRYQPPAPETILP